MRISPTRILDGPSETVLGPIRRFTGEVPDADSKGRARHRNCLCVRGAVLRIPTAAASRLRGSKTAVEVGFDSFSMGSAGVAAWIAHIAFWVLLTYGWFWEELGVRGIGILLVLWLAGLFGLPHVPYGPALFSPFVAVLDVALVFLIFKGDVPLT